MNRGRCGVKAREKRREGGSEGGSEGGREGVREGEGGKEGGRENSLGTILRNGGRCQVHACACGSMHACMLHCRGGVKDMRPSKSESPSALN